MGDTDFNRRKQHRNLTKPYIINFQIRNLGLETIPFTVDSGLLTSTLKLKRNIARELFSERIDRLYMEGSLVDQNV